MPRYRTSLPQLAGDLFLTDAGIETITMNYAEEAIGVAKAAERAGMPVVISLTVETDGKLPTGQTLRAAAAARITAISSKSRRHARRFRSA